MHTIIIWLLCACYIFTYDIYGVCVYIYIIIYIYITYIYIMYLYMVCMCVFTGSVSSHQIIDLYIQLRSIRNPQLGHRKASEWGCYHHFRCPFWMFKAVLSRFWKTRCTVDQSNPHQFWMVKSMSNQWHPNELEPRNQSSS